MTNNIKPNSTELALFWASQGYKVFPVGKDKKPSRGFKWKEHATTDPDMIRAYWDGSHKGAAIGIVTGQYCNRLVLDVDNKDGSKGSESLKALEAEYGALPNTLIVRTPTGGFHYYLTYSDCGLTIDASIYDGIDYRGENGYVLAPNSVTQDGMYTIVNDAPIADMPDWLPKILSRESKPENLKNSESNFLAKGGRNNSLTSIAGTLRRKGMEEDEIKETLLTMNSALPEPLPEHEVESIARSIMRYAPSDTSIYTNEQDFADNVAKSWDGSIRYVSSIGFHYYDKGIWVRDIEGLKTKRLLQDTVTQACVELDKILATKKTKEDRAAIFKLMKNLKKKAFQVSCLDLLKSHPVIVTYPDDLDKHTHIIGLKEGLFDLKSKTLISEGSQYLVTKRINADYDAKAECPLFDAMMVRLFPDESVRCYVLKSLGYALSGSNSEKLFFIWAGSGDNGKTTLIEISSFILDGYSVTLDPESFIRKVGNSISNDIARLLGARMCVTSETSAGAVLDVALVKRLSGNDTISARYLMQEYFEFVNKAVVFMLTNYIPVFDGSDGGMVNRVRIVPFEQVIQSHEKDTSLSEKLKAEASGIFNRLLEAYDVYQSEGLVMPKAVEEATSKFCNQSNLIKQFCDEHVKTGDDFEAGVLSVYDLYADWARRQGYKPLSANIFSTVFEAHTKAHKGRISIGMVWKGIKLAHSGCLDLTS